MTTNRRRVRARCSVLACAWWVLGSTGCRGIPSASKADPEVSSTSTDAITGGRGSSSTTAVAPSTGTTGSVDDTRGTSSSDATGVVFLVEPDGGVHTYECNIITQDCPPGDKCMLWDEDGGSRWNASKCVPVADDPAGADEPCHVERWAYSGIDDCERGAMCFHVDPDTLEGVCVPFCIGDESNPYCEDPLRECSICGDWCLPLCLPHCSPLEQDCLEGQACYPVRDEWQCAPDASGAQGGYGDPCEFLNVCDPGLVCLDVSYVPPGLPCEGALGCCSEICDLADPAGDLQCAGVAEGQVCVAWYEEGVAPPTYENVGACVVPQ